MRKLIRSIPFILLIIWLFVAGCSGAEPNYSDLEERILIIDNNQSVQIHINHGDIRITESEDHQFLVTGKTLNPDSLVFDVNPSPDVIMINANAPRSLFSDTPLVIELKIPRDLSVFIETDSASVSAHTYQGDIEIASTSGNIAVEKVSGKIILRSNRGSITVTDSSGMISVVGNYGLLTLNNVQGRSGVSTIMGNILFQGLVKLDDDVSLETDHGYVTVNLIPSTSSTLQVRSTHGDVTCQARNLTSTTRTCVGVIGDGEGLMTIRTVSGAVNLTLLP